MISYLKQPNGSHFIGGKYVDNDIGLSIDCIFPATGEIITELHAATAEIVDSAVVSARAAQGEWASQPPLNEGAF